MEFELNNKIDAVLPLTQRDYDRFVILEKSIEKNFECIGNLYVVVPSNQFEYFREIFMNKPYELISEQALIPELRYNPKTTGWYRQQLVKLSISERIGTPFFITLDADVICVKTIKYDDLIRDSKAISRIARKDYHPIWYEWAERVLGVKRSGVTHGVTPAIWNKEAVELMHQYLMERVNPAFKFVGKFFPDNSIWKLMLAGWKSYLLRNLPWTEYSLYNTFLEGKNFFHDYHFDGGPYSIYHNSVWKKDQFENWNPADFFDNKEQYSFVVVQSNTGISAIDVWEKVRSHLR